MTAADFAMKRAFDEMARRGHASVAVTAPHRIPPPPPPPSAPCDNVTGYEEPLIDLHGSPTPSPAPRTSLHRYHRLQHSRALSSLSDPDYKHVRRKQSRTSLLHSSFDSAPPAAGSTSPPLPGVSPPRKHHTSSAPEISPPPHYSFLHPLATQSPSLSSSVDTIDTTPTETPLAGTFSAFDFGFAPEGAGLAEPIRTKRKFPLFKPAKRLPHHHNHSRGEGAEFWEVHAVIVDLGGVPDTVGGGERPAKGGETAGSQRKERTVRFEEISETSTTIARREEKSPRSPESSDPTLSSSFSLSKYRFPEPPAVLRAIKAVGPTPHNSPTTLYFNGASFNLVNPHQSLQLDSSQIETPAEIDGLLDDYFRSSNDASMQSYDDITGELSSSQQSITSSNTRQRILYADPQEARQGIMGASPPLGGASPSRSPTVPSSSYQGGSNVVTPRPSNQRMGSRFREDLDRSPLSAPEATTQASSSADPAPGTHSMGTTLEALRLRDRHEEDDRNASDSDTEQARSQRSDPFDLTVDDLVKDQYMQNIGEVIGDRPDNGRAPPGDGADADANADAGNGSGLEPETTVSHILNAYAYDRAPWDDYDFQDIPLQDPTTSSHPSSVEIPRGYNRADDVFQGRYEYGVTPNRYSPAPSAGHTGRMSVAEFLGRRANTQQVRGPPNLPAPVPPRPTDGQKPYYDDCMTLGSSDQTYGSTGQLLQLTPQNAASPYVYPNFGKVSDFYQPYDAQILPRVPEERMEDLQDYPMPRSSEVGDRPVRLTVDRAMLRSSSCYDNDSQWESTQASESQTNLGQIDNNSNPGSATQRNSQISYANTSQCESNNRLSIPRPISAAFASSKNFVDQLSRKFTGKSVHDGPADDVEGGGLDTRTMPAGLNQPSPNFEMPNSSRQMTPTQKPPRGQIDKVVEKGGKMRHITPPKPVYSPQRSLSKASMLGRLPDGHHSASSDRARLLAHQNSPYSTLGLHFSESANSFQTTPRITAAAIDPFSPLPLTPTPLISPFGIVFPRHRSETAAMRHGPRFPKPTNHGEDIEMQRLRPKKRSPAAMSSQTELHPLTLQPSPASATTGRFTDQQLVDAERGWTLEPDFSSTGPLARHITPVGGTMFGIQQNDGTVQNVTLLMRPEEARNWTLLQMQKEYSLPYYILCCLCPVTALLFGFGGLDWRIRQITEGDVTEMSPKMKRRAKIIYFPLSMMLYAIIAIVVVLVVEIE